jgi:hypothetical protein
MHHNYSWKSYSAANEESLKYAGANRGIPFSVPIAARVAVVELGSLTSVNIEDVNKHETVLTDTPAYTKLAGSGLLPA